MFFPLSLPVLLSSEYSGSDSLRECWFCCSPNGVGSAGLMLVLAMLPLIILVLLAILSYWFRQSDGPYSACLLIMLILLVFW